MNQIFDGGSEQYSGKRIMLGISDSHGLQELRSPNGEYQAFVVNRELWMYSRTDSQSTRVFSFRQSETDEMANLQDYGIKLLSAGDDGTAEPCTFLWEIPFIPWIRRPARPRFWQRG